MPTRRRRPMSLVWLVSTLSGCFPSCGIGDIDFGPYSEGGHDGGASGSAGHAGQGGAGHAGKGGAGHAGKGGSGIAGIDSGGAGGESAGAGGQGGGGPTEPPLHDGITMLAGAVNGMLVCALRASGRVTCWGSNFFGELGLGDRIGRGSKPGQMGDDLPAIDLGTGIKATSIVVGQSFVCALIEDGRVKCWGQNDDGILGLGDTSSRGDDPGEMGDALPFVDLGTGARAVSLTTGYGHTCALLDDGRVKCWGDNAFGQLGLGDTNTRGDEPGEMGDNLPAVDLGMEDPPLLLAGSVLSTCALWPGGQLKCWGDNTEGNLALNNTLDSRGDEPGEMGDNLPFVDLGASVVSLATGNSPCATLADGRLVCWGAQSALNSSPTSFSPHSVDLGTGAIVVSVANEVGTSCALLEVGRVKCWGANDDGNLGLGDTEDRHEPGELGDKLPFVDLGSGVEVVSIVSTIESMCALLSSGAIRCWGANNFGELGLGDTSSRGDEPGEMGDALPSVDLGQPIAF